MLIQSPKWGERITDELALLYTAFWHSCYGNGNNWISGITWTILTSRLANEVRVLLAVWFEVLLLLLLELLPFRVLSLLFFYYISFYLFFSIEIHFFCNQETITKIKNEKKIEGWYETMKKFITHTWWVYEVLTKLQFPKQYHCHAYTHA